MFRVYHMIYVTYILLVVMLKDKMYAVNTVVRNIIYNVQA